MMRFVQVPAALLLCFASAMPGVAQSGPAERPPTSFTGQQYVDSRGCVYLRAGYGGQVQWVPRITASRQPLCGYPPSLGAVNIEVAAPAPAPMVAPAPVVVAQPVMPAPRLPSPAQPVRVARSQPVVVAPAPAVQPQPIKVQPVQVAAGPGPGKIGCYKSAPVAMVVALRGGGSAVVCTRGDGTMNGWRPPVYPQGAPVGAALNLPQLAGYQMNGKGQIVIGGNTPALPKGYRTAWTDDRLNPDRSLGTAQGRAAQDQIWTQEVPAQQAAALPNVKAAPGAKARTTVSTNTNAAAGAFYVQVGTFGVPDNARGAAARLSALGLPTAKGNLTKNGKALQIVYAGPFGSQAAAQDALSAARAAGFGDAFIR